MGGYAPQGAGGTPATVLALASGSGTLTERQARVSQAESINTDIIPASNTFWQQVATRESNTPANGLGFRFFDGTNATFDLLLRSQNATASDAELLSLFIMSATRYMRVVSSASAGTYIWQRMGFSYGSGSKLEKVHDLYKKYQAKRNLILSCWHEIAKDGKVVEVKLLQDDEIDFDVNRIVQSVALDEEQFEFDSINNKTIKVANTLDEYIKANIQKWKTHADKKQIGTLCGINQDGDREDIMDIGRKEWNKIAKEIGVSTL